MQHLTEAERAYRRAALQSIQFLIAALVETEVAVPDWLVEWEQALVKARTSLEVRYLGTYMDTVSREVLGKEVPKVRGPF